MRLHSVPLAFALPVVLAAAALPAQAAGVVEVSYVKPENFADVGFGAYERERTLKDMTEMLQSFGKRLPDGRTLKLEVTDINLAGEIRHGRNGDIRVLRGRADWPEVALRYTLNEGATTLKSGEARIHDMTYLDHARRADVESSGPLGNERFMLRKWFDETFGAAAP